MQLRTVRFKQVDVFTSVPFKGNPLAVVFDADDLCLLYTSPSPRDS